MADTSGSLAGIKSEVALSVPPVAAADLRSMKKRVPKESKPTSSAVGVGTGGALGSFDRAAYQKEYMRGYMRKWREKRRTLVPAKAGNPSST